MLVMLGANDLPSSIVSANRHFTKSKSGSEAIEKFERKFSSETKAGFTHANFVGRLKKFSKQTQAKCRLNAMTSPIFKDLGPFYLLFGLGFPTCDVFPTENRHVYSVFYSDSADTQRCFNVHLTLNGRFRCIFWRRSHLYEVFEDNFAWGFWKMVNLSDRFLGFPGLEILDSLQCNGLDLDWISQCHI